MINTFFSLDALGTPAAFFMALLIGAAFGFALERAGFSSSRRMAGVFYFADMAVVKVMFTAMVTAAIGLSYLQAFGWLGAEDVYLMPTIYGAQIVGGLLFGVGFAMSAWCPGTAAAGLAAGRLDALAFLAASVAGSVLFNEVFPWIQSLYTWGDRGTQMVYETLGMQRAAFVLALTAVAVVAFWLCEWAEKLRNGRSGPLGSPFLRAFSLALLAAAAGLSVLAPGGGAVAAPGPAGEQALLAAVEQAEDHVEPEELADRLMAGESDLLVADVRPAAEYAAFHIRGAVNVALPDLPTTLEPHRNRGAIVLYSNGMTHPAQARDALARLGFGNVYLLTDGLQGFRERVLKPVSLRSEPLPPAAAARVQAWRAYFAAPDAARTAEPSAGPSAAPSAVPRLAATVWLQERLGTPGLKVVDLRPQPDYNTSHIPGSLSLQVDSLRGNVGGVPSMLLPATLLAAQFSLLGLTPSDTVVLVGGEKFQDATLPAMAFERVGHTRYAALDGGFAKWAAEGRPVDAALPVVRASDYPVPPEADRFTADADDVRAAMERPGAVILDVRPADFYAGKKSDEARAGHIPGALNRPFSDDVSVGTNKVATLRSVAELAAAYSKLIPSQDSEVIVHCRTGHQASQTFFVLKHVLGYRNVRWYDGGWTEWAARPDLPVATDGPAPSGR